jgi:ABC-type bacteriocin/lantibiotic exporter with double-glycine peptidase domain
MESKKKYLSSLFLLKKISGYLEYKRKKEIIIIFILSIFTTFAEIFTIATIIPLISFFINPESYLSNNFLSFIVEFFNVDNEKKILGLISLVFILLVLTSGYLRIQFIKRTNIITNGITSDFRIRIFNFLINQSFGHYIKHGSNEIMSNMSYKTGFFTVIIFSAINIINAVLIGGGIIFILILNEPFYTSTLILLIFLFFFLFYKKNFLKVYKKGNSINSNYSSMVDIFQKTVGYLPEIIIYNLKTFYSSFLKKTSINTAVSAAEISSIAMTPRIYLEVALIIFTILLMYFMGLNDRSIEANLAYLAILAYSAQKTLPLINNIYNLSVNFVAATPTVENFINILDSGVEQKEDTQDYKTLIFNKVIKVENLFFQYAKNLPMVLKNINLEIKKGEKIIIKGESGTGKTTLTNTISFLLEPSEGSILIDGIKINSKNKKNWQKNIAIIPQTVFLSEGTISENIAIGIDADKIDHDKVEKCSELVHISNFIESLPDGYKTKVGERGIRFSGGQKQRIGMARALYKNANLLIMDEPTNSLDKDTEDLIMNTLANIKKNITIIMVSHSKNSHKYFDRIIELDK